MAITELRTFKDIQDMVMEELKVNDTTTRNRIKRDINAAYLNEVVPYANWEWMELRKELVHNAYTSTGTVAVTQDSKTITFSSAPAETVKGYLFSVDGGNDVYEIDSHTAASTTATLKTAFIEDTNASANYKLVKAHIPLPVDMDDVTQVYHGHHRSSLQNVNYQQFTELMLNSQFAGGRPYYYTMTDYIDPDPYDTITGFPTSSSRTSSGFVRAITFLSDPGAYIEIGDKIKVSGAGDDDYNGEFIVEDIDSTNYILYYSTSTQLTESSTSDSGITIEAEDRERANEVRRALQFYPNYHTESTLIKVIGVKRPSAMDADTDEPEIPLQDRMVLVYGALSRAWSRLRNPEEAGRNEQLFQRKLARMAAKIKAKQDNPRLQVNPFYLTAKRLNQRRKNNWENF